MSMPHLLFVRSDRSSSYPAVVTLLSFALISKQMHVLEARLLPLPHLIASRATHCPDRWKEDTKDTKSCLWGNIQDCPSGDCDYREVCGDQQKCPCLKGFQEDENGVCVDVDECSIRVNSTYFVDHQDVLGIYLCYDGVIKSINKTSSQSCHACQNKLGGYTCGCRSSIIKTNQFTCGNRAGDDEYFCTAQVRPCFSNPCKNGATCNDPGFLIGDKKICTCKGDFEGDFCELEERVIPWSTILPILGGGLGLFAAIARLVMLYWHKKDDGDDKNLDKGDANAEENEEVKKRYELFQEVLRAMESQKGNELQTAMAKFSQNKTGETPLGSGSASKTDVSKMKEADPATGKKDGKSEDVNEDMLTAPIGVNARNKGIVSIISFETAEIANFTLPQVLQAKAILSDPDQNLQDYKDFLQTVHDARVNQDGDGDDDASLQQESAAEGAGGKNERASATSRLLAEPPVPYVMKMPSPPPGPRPNKSLASPTRTKLRQLSPMKDDSPFMVQLRASTSQERPERLSRQADVVTMASMTAVFPMEEEDVDEQPERARIVINDDTDSDE